MNKATKTLVTSALKMVLEDVIGGGENHCDTCGGEVDGLEFHKECYCFKVREALAAVRADNS